MLNLDSYALNVPDGYKSEIYDTS